jgi:outer membrane protein insertion porin family
MGWLLWGLLCHGLSPATAQVLAPQPTEPTQDTIAQIRVEGNQRIEVTTIRSYMTVAPGDPFDPAQLDQSLKNLFATGLFDDVALRRDGDVLVVTVVENPIINRIAFEGNEELDDEVLESEVQLRPRVVYTRSRVQNAVSRVLELYRRNGRFAATVEPKVIQLPENRVDLVFEINEGPLTEVRRIVFLGNKAYSDSALRDVIQTTMKMMRRTRTTSTSGVTFISGLTPLPDPGWTAMPMDYSTLSSTVSDTPGKPTPLAIANKARALP